MLTPETLSELRALAEECASGSQRPWRVEGDDGRGPYREEAHLIQGEGEFSGSVAQVTILADARYLAAADPWTVMAMVDEIHRLRAELERARRSERIAAG